jgi:hypothetical protein
MGGKRGGKPKKTLVHTSGENENLTHNENARSLKIDHRQHTSDSDHSADSKSHDAQHHLPHSIQQPQTSASQKHTSHVSTGAHDHLQAKDSSSEQSADANFPQQVDDHGHGHNNSHGHS